MGRVTTRHRVVRIDAHHPAGITAVDTLAVEEPLEIRLGEASYATTMRTPGHDIELVHGFLASEGIIAGPADVVDARYCTGTVTDEETGRPRNTYNVLQVRLTDSVPPPRTGRATVVSSACGICGTDTVEALTRDARFDLDADHTRVAASTLLGLPDRLRDAQRTFSATGATHAAALFTDDGSLLVAREDVGRHNAVDKVVGWAMLNGQRPGGGCVLMVSGRIGFELAQKSVLAGIPVLAGISAPTALAVRIAEETGLTLAGFVRGDRMSLYANPERVLGTDTAE